MSSFKEQLAILSYSLLIFPVTIMFIVNYFNPKIGFSRKGGILGALEKPDNQMLRQANYWFLLAIIVSHVSILLNSINKRDLFFVALFAWLREQRDLGATRFCEVV